MDWQFAFSLPLQCTILHQQQDHTKHTDLEPGTIVLTDFITDLPDLPMPSKEYEGFLRHCSCQSNDNAISLLCIQMSTCNDLSLLIHSDFFRSWSSPEEHHMERGRVKKMPIRQAISALSHAGFAIELQLVWCMYLCMYV
jgi:hypothetical protein